MITAANLRTLTLKDLSQMAKKNGINGSSSMRKEELVKALVKTMRKSTKVGPNGKTRSAPKKTTAKKASSRNGNATKVVKKAPAKKAAAKKTAKKKVVAKKAVARKTPAKKVAKARPAKTAAKGAKTVAAKAKPTKAAKPAKKVSTTVTRRLKRFNDKMEKGKDLSAKPLKPAPLTPGKKNKARSRLPEGKDRVVLLVLDPFWLQAYWEVTRQSVERAQAAMAESWHGAKPVLRVYEVETGSTTSTAESMVRQIEVHGGVKNWYIDVKNPPKSYRVELGYVADNGRFFALCRSNTVSTPSPGSSDALDRNWSDVAENYEKIYAMSGGYSNEPDNKELQELFEERLRRPMGAPVVTRYGAGADSGIGRERDFQFELDAEMIIYGSTKADAHVTLSGEPVRLRPDGTFTVRLSMPDKRQVIPAVAASGDGVEQRTIVLAVERNTKVMEPMIRESGS